MILQTLSLEALYYDLINSVSGGRTTKDFSISSDQVKSFIIAKRAKYLAQMLSKNKKPETTFSQSFCVDMEPVDASLCGCDVELGCTFLRSTLPLPQLIQLNRIGPINSAAKNWQLIPYERVALEAYAPKYSLKKPKFYIRDFDNYLYAYVDKDINPESLYLTKTGITGILVDPRAIYPFSCATGNCYSDNDQFPMTRRLWEMVKQDIISTELRIAMITDMDEHNNSKGDAEVNNLRKLNVQKAQD